jgi:hypothetical protein
MGIAFDGKIVGQFSKTQFETAVKGCPENHLTVYNYLWLKLLTDAHDKSPPPTRLQVATSLVQKIKGNRL